MTMPGILDMMNEIEEEVEKTREEEKVRNVGFLLSSEDTACRGDFCVIQSSAFELILSSVPSSLLSFLPHFLVGFITKVRYY